MMLHLVMAYVLFGGLPLGLALSLAYRRHKVRQEIGALNSDELAKE
jgi:hypothetical protein